VSKIDATPDEVWRAFSQPERSSEMMPDSFKQSKLVSSEGNKKVVDVVAVLEILPPGFKIQNPASRSPTSRREAHHDQDDRLPARRHHLGVQVRARRRRQGDLVRVDQQNKPRPSIVESLQKGAIRESYINQIRAANKGIAQERPGPAKRLIAADRRAHHRRTLPRRGRPTRRAPPPGRPRSRSRPLERRQVVADQLPRRPPRPGARQPDARTHAAAQLLPPERALRARRPPGYGFAVGPEEEQRAWGPLVEATCASGRPSAGSLVIDARRGVETEEEQAAGVRGAPRPRRSSCATKLDKLAAGAARRRRRAPGWLGARATLSDSRRGRGGARRALARPRRMVRGRGARLKARRPNG
jgi:hypothetical protein